MIEDNQEPQNDCNFLSSPNKFFPRQAAKFRKR